MEAWDEYELVDVSCCDVYADGGLYSSSFTLQVRQSALLPTSDLTVYHLMSLWSQLLRELHASLPQLDHILNRWCPCTIPHSLVLQDPFCFHLCLCLLSCFYPSGKPTKFFYAYFTCLHVVLHAPPILSSLSLWCLMVILSTARFNTRYSEICHSMCVCVPVWPSQQTTIISLYIINWLVFLVVAHFVLYEVRTNL